MILRFAALDVGATMENKKEYKYEIGEILVAVFYALLFCGTPFALGAFVGWIMWGKHG